MCGASLLEREDEPERDEDAKREIPSWVGSLAAFVLAVIILGAGGLGLYTMLDVEPGPEPTAIPVTPSPTPTLTPSPTPTETPAPTSTPTPLPPRAHNVQEGETMSDIAEEYGVVIDDILALNPDVDAELIQPGQVLLVPARTPEAGASASIEAEDTPGEFVIHVVSSGETLSSIAEEYDVAVSVIRAANDLAPDDETIRAKQSLVIPLNTPTPTPTPTANPNVTPTPVPPYPPPPLLYPPDGAILTDGAPVLLQWASVSVLKADEWYELSLRQPGRGVVSSTVRTRATAWRVPSDLLQKADSDAAEFLWSVRVVREVDGPSYAEAGYSSGTRLFVWRGSTRTPSLDATPTP
jgi:LysM repeat protein